MLTDVLRSKDISVFFVLLLLFLSLEGQKNRKLKMKVIIMIDWRLTRVHIILSCIFSLR